MLAELTDFKLKSAGVDDKEERKLVMTAIRKAGYKPSPARIKQDKGLASAADAQDTVAGPSHADVSVSAWKPLQNYTGNTP